MLKDVVNKMIDRFIELVNSFIGWVLLVLCQFISIEGVHVGLIMLLTVFCIDYITGLGAAWNERHAVKSDAPFFLESKKIRNSLLKASTYLLFIFMSWMMWYLFFDDKVPLPVSTREFNIISITIGICIAIEMWSILENMKRMGFDLFGKLGKTATQFWKIFNQLKHG